MKIISHNIEMHSKHLEYKSIQESQLSFSTFLQDVPEEKDISQNTQALSFNFSTSIQEMIQHLLENLRRNTQTQNTSKKQNQDTVGYTHISLHEKYEEKESVTFHTKGKIQTENTSIDIDLNFSMSRSLIVENQIDIFSTFDPLVINLDGEMPQLSSQTFAFDLDNNGTKEQISKLKANSGFLALDKNSDGIINQGSELFGTQSGNGFGELSQYDLDHNGWIDENDTIFDKLQVWFHNEETKDKELVALGEAGVGAIFLGSAQSDFTYKSDANKVLGELKSSGIFLKEDGSVGNIAQIDLAQRDEPLGELLQA